MLIYKLSDTSHKLFRIYIKDHLFGGGAWHHKVIVHHGVISHYKIDFK